MNKKINLIILIALFTFVISAMSFGAEITGYLNDSLCGIAGYPEGYKGKIDLTINPENHPIACLTMDNCAEEGYGISIAQKDGKYKYFKFDKKGSGLIKKEVLDKIKDKLAKTPLLTLDAEIKDDVVIINKIISYKLQEKTGKPDKSKMNDMKM